MVDRFHSRALELPESGHPISRVDLVLYEVDHSGASYEGRVFVGGKKPAAAAGVEHPSYVGSFHVFGHGRCQGEEGHCDVPTEHDPFDLRLPHHLEPHLAIVTVTDAVTALIDAGKEKATVTIAAHDGGGEPVEALAFTGLRLITYA
jgi:hypothetical protein